MISFRLIHRNQEIPVNIRQFAHSVEAAWSIIQHLYSRAFVIRVDAVVVPRQPNSSLIPFQAMVQGLQEGLECYWLRIEEACCEESAAFTVDHVASQPLDDSVDESTHALSIASPDQRVESFLVALVTCNTESQTRGEQQLKLFQGFRRQSSAISPTTDSVDSLAEHIGHCMRQRRLACW